MGNRMVKAMDYLLYHLSDEDKSCVEVKITSIMSMKANRVDFMTWSNAPLWWKEQRSHNKYLVIQAKNLEKGEL